MMFAPGSFLAWHLIPLLRHAKSRYCCRFSLNFLDFFRSYMIKFPMVKLKVISNQGPISKKVLSSFDRFLKQKVVNISTLREASIKSEEFRKTIISEKRLSVLDPIHAVYAYAQNMISGLVEQLAELPALRKLNNAYAEAQDLYLPSGPPMSPLTASYFSCWGYFDLGIGLRRESFAAVAIDVCKLLEVDPGLIKVFEIFRDSRMGFYVYEDRFGEKVLFRELITDKQIKAIVPSGYHGNPGETWFARILPEPFEELNLGYSVVFTTPYIISEQINGKFVFANEENWLVFFARNLGKTNINERNSAYKFFMKYGLDRNYWNEYIFEAYVNHQHDMIILAGFPDIPLSRPHSRESEEKRGD